MTREQMIEKAADAILERCFGVDPPEAPIDLARGALDAILPQVSTVEEVEGLDGEALLLTDAGVSYRRWMLTPCGDVEDVLADGPLTVVWQP